MSLNAADTAPVVASQVLTLALHDLTQIALIIGFVFIGWFVWSLILQNVCRKPGKGCKLDDVSESTRARSGSSESEEEVSSIHLPGHALLEAYGVLGASPGTWSS